MLRPRAIGAERVIGGRYVAQMTVVADGCLFGERLVFAVLLAPREFVVAAAAAVPNGRGQDRRRQLAFGIVPKGKGVLVRGSPAFFLFLIILVGILVGSSSTGGRWHIAAVLVCLYVCVRMFVSMFVQRAIFGHGRYRYPNGAVLVVLKRKGVGSANRLSIGAGLKRL